MENIKQKFSIIEDERHQSYVEHKLCDILIIIMCAVLCGLDELAGIVEYANNKSDFLREAFGIDKTPSKPTFCRILNMIDGDKADSVIIEIMKENVCELGEIIAVDGKATIEIKSPVCGGVNVIRYGISASKNQRYYCKDVKCKGKSFQLEHSYTGCKVGINEKIVAMAANASGIRDTSRVLGVSQKKVMSTLKKQVMQ